MEQENFRHKLTFRVLFHEVDLLGVVNNAVYFSYFETARLEYLKQIGFWKEIGEMAKEDKVFIMVHNDCDYMESALYDDELTVLTRIKYIRNSSFGFEHLIVKNSSGNIIARGHGAMTHIYFRDRKSIPLPQTFREAVTKFEGSLPE
ncbi:MAG: acyl-CoA thioesterase [Syntrophothermus sp.]